MRFLYVLFSVATAMIGYNIHGSVFWSVMNFIFTVFSWIKWLICKDVTLKIIKDSFSWFFV